MRELDTVGRMEPRLLNVDWNDLLTFLKVSQKKSVRSAALVLRVDVTTVRRRLAALETHLGLKLFEGSGRAFKPTPEGDRIYAIAAEMDALSIKIAGGVESAIRELTGVVRISTMEGFGSRYLAPRLHKFTARHPGLTVQLINAAHTLNLGEREADISINMLQPRTGRLVVRKAGQFGVGLYASRAYLERNGFPRKSPDLARHSFISYVDDMISVPDVRWLLDLGIEARVRLEFTSLVSQYESARAGAGLAMLPAFMVDAADDLVRIFPKQVHVLRDWWLVVHQDLQQVPRIRAAIDFMVEIIKRDQVLLLGKS